MSTTNKQTDTIQEDRKSICSDTDKKLKRSKDKISVAMAEWAC